MCFWTSQFFVVLAHADGQIKSLVSLKDNYLTNQTPVVITPKIEIEEIVKKIEIEIEIELKKL